MKKFLATALAALLLVTVFVPIAAKAYTDPPELANAFPIGTWPLAAGQYDPGLDEHGIKDGTHVYGLFASDYSAVAAPTAIAGYTKVDTVAALKDGTWTVVSTNNGMFSYVLIVGEPVAAAPADPDPVDEGDTTPPVEEAAPPVEEAAPPVVEATPPPAEEVAPPVLDAAPPVEEAAPPADEAPVEITKTVTKTVIDLGFIQLTTTGLQSKYYPFDLSVFGGTGVVYALYFDNGATVTFSTAVTLSTFDADFNMLTKDIAAGSTVSVSSINGYSLYLDETFSNAICFVLASNPLNYAGLEPTAALSTLPGTVSTIEDTVTVAVTADTSVMLWIALGFLAVCGSTLIVSKKRVNAK